MDSSGETQCAVHAGQELAHFCLECEAPLCAACLESHPHAPVPVEAARRLVTDMLAAAEREAVAKLAAWTQAARDHLRAESKKRLGRLRAQARVVTSAIEAIVAEVGDAMATEDAASLVKIEEHEALVRAELADLRSRSSGIPSEARQRTAQLAAVVAGVPSLNSFEAQIELSDAGVSFSVKSTVVALPVSDGGELHPHDPAACNERATAAVQAHLHPVAPALEDCAPAQVAAVLQTLAASLKDGAICRVHAVGSGLVPFALRVLSVPALCGAADVVVEACNALRWSMSGEKPETKCEAAAQELLAAGGIKAVLDATAPLVGSPAVPAALGMLMRVYARWPSTWSDALASDASGVLFAALDVTVASMRRSCAEACLSGLRNACNRMVNTQTLVARQEWFETLRRCMDAFMNDQDIQLHALALLWGWGVYDVNRRPLAQWGAAGVLLSTAQTWRGNTGVTGMVLGAIRALVLDELGLDRVWDSGGLSTVLDAMAQTLPSAYCQEQGCSALLNMAARPAMREGIVDASGVQAVVTAMRTHTSRCEVQVQGCLGLGSLARYRPAGLRAVHDAGGEAAVVAAMAAFPASSSMQDFGAKCLAVLRAA